jgi:hypothetical protein
MYAALRFEAPGVVPVVRIVWYLSLNGMALVSGIMSVAVYNVMA